MATDAEILKHYTDLLILQYREKPKAKGHIEAHIEPIIMGQLPDEVQNAYNIDTAVGVQLDIVGIYAGVVRLSYLSDGTPINLNDVDFRQLIRMAVLRNNSGSSLFDIQFLLNEFFPSQVFAFDNANMSMSYLIDSSVGSLELVQSFILQDLLPKPMAVALASIIFLPEIDNLYGFRTYEAPGVNISPMNSYAVYEMDRPWLSYTDTIVL